MPVDAVVGIPEKKASYAASPPAEAPIPTMGMAGTTSCAWTCFSDCFSGSWDPSPEESGDGEAGGSDFAGFRLFVGRFFGTTGRLREVGVLQRYVRGTPEGGLRGTTTGRPSNIHPNGGRGKSRVQRCLHQQSNSWIA